MNILVVYRSGERIYGWATGNMIADAFRDLGHEVDEFGEVYETGESITSPAYHPNKYYNLMLVLEHGDPKPIPFFLKENQPHDLLAYWTFDISYKIEHELNVIRLWEPDHILCANYYHCQTIEQLLDMPVTFLPYACCPKRHFREIGSVPKTRDIALVGTARPDRVKLISDLRSEGLNAHLVSGVFKEDYITALAESRVVINQNPPQGRGILNMRFWEVPAAGSLLYTQAGDGEHLFKHGSTYCDIYDLVTGIKYDLGLAIHKPLDCHIEVRISSSQNYILKNHTYKNRAKTILDITES